MHQGRQSVKVLYLRYVFQALINSLVGYPTIYSPALLNMILCIKGDNPTEVLYLFYIFWTLINFFVCWPYTVLPCTPQHSSVHQGRQSVDVLCIRGHNWTNSNCCIQNGVRVPTQIFKFLNFKYHGKARGQLTYLKFIWTGGQINVFWNWVRFWKTKVSLLHREKV